MDTATTEQSSPRSRLAAALLCFFLGWAGAHRFYAGKHGTAVLMLCTLGGLGIWSTVDLVFILVGSFRDAEGRRLRSWEERPAPVRADERLALLRQRLDGIESRLTEVQGGMIDLAEKSDRFRG
ncbi:MAG: TM2 domain-containing protein [Gemmatimonadota bacterium]